MSRKELPNVKHNKLRKSSKLQTSVEELIVKVTEDGNWIIPDSKGKMHVWSSAMPISSMGSLIALYFGLPVFDEFQFKIVKIAKP